jgi:hypothetical protein
VEEKAEDQDSMELAEHDLLADLRRAPLASASGHGSAPSGCAPDAGAKDSGRGRHRHGIVELYHRSECDPVRLDNRQPDRCDEGWDPYPFILLNLALSFQAAYAAPVIMMSQNRQQDIDRKAAENDYRINVKAELEIELMHEKVDQLREREVLKLTEAVRTLTELLKQSASGARESDAGGGRPSYRAAIDFMA